MEASPVKIINYLDGTKQGIIPLFQRPYSWEQKDWKMLWDDVMAQYDPEERSTHFMGAIVTVPVNSVPVGVSKHLVIDGQQRLTTLSILLCAIRDAETSEDRTRGIIGDLLINRHCTSPDDLKLVPTQSDRGAYSALVKGSGHEAYDQSSVVQAYNYFKKQVRGTDQDDQPIKPQQLLEALQQALQVVMINLSATDDPYLIFESLNHKGKPLTEADLVRNYVLMRFQHSTVAGGEQEIIYDTLWRPMEAALGDNLSEFLRHYNMRHGAKIRKGEIYSSFKRGLDALADSNTVKSNLDELKHFALAYEKFLDPSKENETEVARRLERMIALDSKVFFPLLMRIYRAWQNEVIGMEVVTAFLDHLESFYIRRLICGIPTNALNKLTLEWCNHLPDSAQDSWLADRMRNASAPGRKWPTDEEFTEALITQPIYTRSNAVRYVLLNLELAHDHKELTDFTNATIEHVMPRNLSQGWRETLGANAEAIHGKWLDTLGNLTLTAYNSELSNNEFSEKKVLLGQSHFELNRWISEQQSWSDAEIRARAESLAKMAVKRWPR